MTRVPLKYRIPIAVVVSFGGWTAFALYLQRELNRMKRENIENRDQRDRALKFVLDKALQGDYEHYENAHEQMMNDYEFYYLAEREKGLME